MKSGMFTKAITRRPALSLGRGLTSADLGAPNPVLAARQHEAYCEALRSCGVEVIVLDPVEEFPDSTFVEDTAVIAGHRAMITRPGHPSRLGEADLIEPVLSRYLEVDRISPPGRIDGGDVLEVDDLVLIGLSKRTNMEGARQLGTFLAREGFRSATVRVKLGLHLKSGLSYLGNGVALADSSMSQIEGLSGLDVIGVADGEDYCANCITVNGRLIFPSGFPGTLALLARTGVEIIELDMSEFRKMDGGLSCLSLRMDTG
jgi:dimethylargininase